MIVPKPARDMQFAKETIAPALQWIRFATRFSLPYNIRVFKTPGL